MAKTLFEKIWDRHLVASIDESTNLVFIDLHLVHEVTSPQAFDSLRLAGRKVKHPEMTLATVDHGVPTSNNKSTTPISAKVDTTSPFSKCGRRPNP